MKTLIKNLPLCQVIGLMEKLHQDGCNAFFEGKGNGDVALIIESKEVYLQCREV